MFAIKKTSININKPETKYCRSVTFMKVVMSVERGRFLGKLYAQMVDVTRASRCKRTEDSDTNYSLNILSLFILVH